MSTPLPPPPPSAVPPPPSAVPGSVGLAPAAAGAKKSGVPKVVILVAAVVLGALAVAVLSDKGSKSTVTTIPAVTAVSANGPQATTNQLPVKLGETQPVVVTGASLAELPDKGDDPAIGQPAPAIAGRDFQGAPVVVTPGDGKAKLMLFVAHWCPHCQREVPLVVKWMSDGSIPKTIDVVAVSTSYKPAQGNPPSKWLAKEGWSSTIVADDEKSTAALAYGLTGFPFFTLVDAKGNVVGRDSGELDLASLQVLLARLA